MSCDWIISWSQFRNLSWSTYTQASLSTIWKEPYTQSSRKHTDVRFRAAGVRQAGFSMLQHMTAYHVSTLNGCSFCWWVLYLALSHRYRKIHKKLTEIRICLTPLQRARRNKKEVRKKLSNLPTYQVSSCFWWSAKQVRLSYNNCYCELWKLSLHPQSLSILRNRADIVMISRSALLSWGISFVGCKRHAEPELR